jgi:hypothetical protein
MTRHQDFSTEEFLLYAAECKRMAELARPLKRTATANAAASPGWAELVSHAATRHHQQRQSYLGLGNQAVYS